MTVGEQLQAIIDRTLADTSVAASIFGPTTEKAVRNMNGRIEVMRENWMPYWFSGASYGGYDRWERGDDGVVRQAKPEPPPTYWVELKPRQHPIHSLTWHWWQRQKSKAAEAKSRITTAWLALKGELPEYED